MPSVQGVYDALRGGHRNLGADRNAATALEKAFPGTGERMLEERDFKARAVTWAADSGLRQFIVAGAGMPGPAAQNVHEAARAAVPGAVTVYASADPYAAAWNRALLAENDPLVEAVDASVLSPAGIFGHPAVKKLIDLGAPACVVVPMVLHFFAPADAGLILREIAAPLAPGSVVAVSAWAGGDPARAGEFSRLFAVGRVWRHEAADLAGWMSAAGLRIVPEPRDGHPGVVDARLWPEKVWAAGKLPGGLPGRVQVAVGVRG
jgi:hypothetical protein